MTAAIGFVDPRVLLGRHSLRPKRSFGQNFLVASAVVDKIAALCVPHEETRPVRVVEIGAGLGTLTASLLDHGASVVAIERDRDLVPVLAQELAAPIATGALTLLEADAATVDFDALLGHDDGLRVLAGNLPYQITGRLLELATLLGTRVDRVVVMVQREVADRLIAAPSTKAYGQLTIFAQAAFEIRRAFIVSPGSFHPVPSVDSAVVVMTPRSPPRAKETETFRAVVHAAFGARRKTLKNALGTLIAEAPVLAAVEATGIDLRRRGETLSVEEMAKIADAIDGAR